MEEGASQVTDSAENQPAINGTEHGLDVEMKDELAPEVSLSVCLLNTRFNLINFCSQPNLQPSTTPPIPPTVANELAPQAQPQSRTHTPPARGSPHPSPAAAPPSQANPHGSPTRIFLNQNV